MDQFDNPLQWILGLLLIFSSLGVIVVRKPVHACLCFLMSLVTLATLYLQLSAPFIAMMQVWVYAGAILVIFMFVIVLFQDAHAQISRSEAKSYPLLLFAAAFAFLLNIVLLGDWLYGLTPFKDQLEAGFGTIQHLGEVLYMDFFFPFEAVILLFLIAVVGGLYIGRRER